MKPVVYGILIATVLIAAARAHEGEDALAAWYRSLIAPDGKSCCTTRDCAPAEARLVGDHWEVWIVPYEGDPKWVSVPPDKVLRRENPDGRPIVCRTPNGFIFCFVPPAGT
jgi:hypothetical protein